MRLVFAGTPAFAASALRALREAGHDVAMVLTQPDRPAGRGLRPRVSEVKALASAYGVPLAQPTTLKSHEALEGLRSARAQAMVVAAYGLILPPLVLELFPFGCINIHASLLPRWRGAAPIQRAILAGDWETGISIMRMEARLDTGPVYLARSVAIESDDTAGSLHDKLAALGARCIVQVLAGIEAGEIRATPQPERGVTYAKKIEKHEATIDWSAAAAQIERQVRAFNPLPVAGSSLRGARLRVWRATAAAEPHDTPGRVIQATNAGILVGCGSGALLLQELQRAGGKPLSAADFLRGTPLAPGEILGQ
jgi:methionyl-tRNA formyltransferase